MPPTGAEAEHVFAAAAAGDAVALKILDRLADRMARVIGSVATIINPELVVIGGAVANSAGVLLEAIAARLPEFTATPPRVAVPAGRFDRDRGRRPARPGLRGDEHAWTWSCHLPA